MRTKKELHVAPFYGSFIFVARVIHGLGFGLSTTFAAALAADVIPVARRGEGIGYFGMGSTVAMALAPALGLYLLEQSAAWLFFAAVAVCLLALIMAYVCKNREVVTELPPTPPLHASIRNRLCERGMGGPSLLTILFGVGYGSVTTFVAMLAAEKSVDNAGLFFVVGTLFVFISRPFGGRLLDKYGAFAVVLPGAVSYLLALVIMVMADSLTGFLAASVFYGLGAGTLMPALLTWMFNVVRTESHSAASATFYNMLDIGTSTGLIVLGTLAGSVGYTRMFMYVMGIMALFLLLAIFQYYHHSEQVLAEAEEV